MSVRVEIQQGPLAPLAPLAPDALAGAGAVAQFEGVVRPSEERRALAALEYEAYRPMAEEMLQALAEEAMAEFALSAVLVQHSVGSVAVGERSFRLLIAAEHRAPAMRAMASFIDRMKRDVPIWKRPVYAGAAEARS